MEKKEKPSPKRTLGESGLKIAQFILPISGLWEVRNSKKGNIIEADNIAEKLSEIDKEVKTKPWLRQLFTDVRKGDKSGIFKLTVAGLVITIAAYGGYKLIAHERDLKDLVDRLENHQEEKDTKV